jgi:hypothetical protein
MMRKIMNMKDHEKNDGIKMNTINKIKSSDYLMRGNEWYTSPMYSNKKQYINKSEAAENQAWCKEF